MVKESIGTIKRRGERLCELFSDLDSPGNIAAKIDEIIFDWALGGDEPLQDWHKERLFALKTLRDFFNKISTDTTPADSTV